MAGVLAVGNQRIGNAPAFLGRWRHRAGGHRA
jgi:hypothetical protein